MTAAHLRDLATEVAEKHTAFIEGTLPGCDRDVIERALLDPTIDPFDVRYKDNSLYGGEFAVWLRKHAERALTFTATHDLMREVLLTQEMMSEEGLDYLPLLRRHLPSPDGFMLFPYGVECPFIVEPSIVGAPAGSITWSRWMVDGFIWTTSDRVASDGVADTPTDGVVIFPLTRNRLIDGDRPFFPDLPLPIDTLAASDITAWAFDGTDETEWPSMADIHQSWSKKGYMLGGLGEVTDVLETLHDIRWWTRSLVWSCWRWMTEEIWLDGDMPRATRRRLDRAKPVIHENQPEDGQVIVVELRQERKDAIERGEANGETPWWRTRWIVRGHWARRRYAIKDDNGNNIGPVRGPDSIEGVTFYYDRVWIEPYEKGPDNAPLVMRDPVGVLCR